MDKTKRHRRPDAVDIMRKSAEGGFPGSTGYIFDNAKVLLGVDGIDGIDGCYILNTLADMVERDYVRREKCEAWKKLVKQWEAMYEEVLAERDELKRAAERDADVMEALNVRLSDMTAERDEWKAKAEQAQESYLDTKHDPLLKASDGAEIRIGETLYGLSDGKAWEVRCIHHGEKYAVLGFREGETRALKPEWLTHEGPVPWSLEKALERFWRNTDGIVFPSDKDCKLGKEIDAFAAEIREKLAKEGGDEDLRKAALPGLRAGEEES